MKKTYCRLTFLVVLVSLQVACNRGTEITVIFSENPNLPEESKVFWDDFPIGEVRSTGLSPKGEGVAVTVRIDSDHADVLDGRLVFYRETDWLGNNKGQELKTYRCESRPVELADDYSFEGYLGSHLAKASCFWEQFSDWTADLTQKAKAYWASPEGQENRKKLEEYLEKAKDGSKDVWGDLKDYGEKVAEDMRRKDWDKEADDFLIMLETQIKQLRNR